MFHMAGSLSSLLIVLSLGYLTFIFASKEEGMRKFIGRILAISIITISAFLLILKCLCLCYCLSQAKGWEKCHGSFKSSFYHKMRKMSPCGRIIK